MTQDYLQTTLGVTTYKQTRGANVGSTSSDPYTVMVGVDSGFFSAYPPDTNVTLKVPDPNTGELKPLQMTLLQYQMLTLLHELGHTTGAFLPDANDNALNSSYTAAVLKDCL